MLLVCKNLLVPFFLLYILYHIKFTSHGSPYRNKIGLIWNCVLGSNCTPLYATGIYISQHSQTSYFPCSLPHPISAQYLLLLYFESRGGGGRRVDVASSLCHRLYFLLPRLLFLGRAHSEPCMQDKHECGDFHTSDNFDEFTFCVRLWRAKRILFLISKARHY